MTDKLNHNLSHPSYRPDIDGLRAVAILMVLIYHCFPSVLKAGFIGVDIFFVISGYLISSIIFKNLEQNTFSFKEFYSRRIRRIFPVLIIVLTSCLIFGWFFLYQEEYQEIAFHSASSAIFLTNFQLLKESGYFDNEATLKPILHLWSLSIEEQFYILWPLLLWLIFRKKHNSHNFLFISCFIAILSFIANILIVKHHPEAAFYLPFCRFWEIMIGGILAYLQLHQKQFDHQNSTIKFILASSNYKSIFGILLIILSLFIIDRHQQFPGYFALLPCLGAFLIISAGANNNINRYFLANKLMVSIGLISYPLYLWHWPLISFATIIKGKEPRPELMALIIFLSVVLAYLSYKFIETPIRHGKKDRGKIIITLVGLMVIIFTASSVIIKMKGIEDRGNSKKYLLIRTMNRGQAKIDDCLSQYPQIKDLTYCQISGSGENKILVIGDSHSQAIFNGYSQTLKNQDYQIIHLANSGCPFYTPNKDLDDKPIVGGQDIASCNKMFQQIIDIVAQEKPQQILFANNGWIYRQADFESAMQATLQMLPSKIPITYFLQIPKMPFMPLSCISRSSNQELELSKCSFARKLHNQNIAEYLTIISNLVNAHQNLNIIDPSEAICDANMCYGLVNQEFLYAKDGSHLSISGGVLIAKKFPINRRP
jgi:peptidoglycan/LPS O-acetylase OafA/YrhL